MYAQNAASVNEFLGHSWDKVIFSPLQLLNIPDVHAFLLMLNLFLSLSSLCRTMGRIQARH